MAKNLDFGANGTVLKAAGTLTGNYNVIVAREDSVVTSVTNWVGADSPETITLDKGEHAYGVFTTVVWVSGSIVAYN